MQSLIEREYYEEIEKYIDKNENIGFCNFMLNAGAALRYGKGIKQPNESKSKSRVSIIDNEIEIIKERFDFLSNDELMIDELMKISDEYFEIFQLIKEERLQQQRNDRILQKTDNIQGCIDRITRVIQNKPFSINQFYKKEFDLPKYEYLNDKAVIKLVDTELYEKLQDHIAKNRDRHYIMKIKSYKKFCELLTYRGIKNVSILDAYRTLVGFDPEMIEFEIRKSDFLSKSERDVLNRWVDKKCKNIRMAKYDTLINGEYIFSGVQATEAQKLEARKRMGEYTNHPYVTLYKLLLREIVESEKESDKTDN